MDCRILWDAPPPRIRYSNTNVLSSSLVMPILFVSGIKATALSAKNTLQLEEVRREYVHDMTMRQI